MTADLSALVEALADRQAEQALEEYDAFPELVKRALSPHAPSRIRRTVEIA